MGRLALCSFMFAAVACASEEPSDKQRCEKVRDRIVDLQLANASGVDVKAHRVAMKAALGDDFIASCASKLTSAQQRCVLDATDAAGATACASRTR